jgi:hypothetical protein
MLVPVPVCNTGNLNLRGNLERLTEGEKRTMTKQSIQARIDALETAGAGHFTMQYGRKVRAGEKPREIDPVWTITVVPGVFGGVQSHGKKTLEAALDDVEAKYAVWKQTRIEQLQQKLAALQGNPTPAPTPAPAPATDPRYGTGTPAYRDGDANPVE